MLELVGAAVVFLGFAFSPFWLLTAETNHSLQIEISLEAFTSKTVEADYLERFYNQRVERMKSEKQIGSEMNKFAMTKLEGIDKRKAVAAAYMYSRMVMYYNKLGTNSAKQIFTNKTRYTILKKMSEKGSVNYMLNKTRYYNNQFQHLIDARLIKLDGNTVVLNCPWHFDNKNSIEAGLPGWITDDALSVFRAMHTYCPGNEQQLILNFGTDMTELYFKVFKGEGYEKAKKILEMVKRKSSQAYEKTSDENKKIWEEKQSRCTEQYHEIAEDVERAYQINVHGHDR
tara:strand:+ start:24111 stop:24968 length:858 start_codon:yes stop_codon:yes gene_type:complete